MLAQTSINSAHYEQLFLTKDLELVRRIRQPPACIRPMVTVTIPQKCITLFESLHPRPNTQ